MKDITGHDSRCLSFIPMAMEKSLKNLKHQSDDKIFLCAKIILDNKTTSMC